jgi:hypothetical protein
MPQPTLTLYVDIVSPFAYIAFYILKVRFVSSLKEGRRGQEREREIGADCVV